MHVCLCYLVLQLELQKQKQMQGKADGHHMQTASALCPLPEAEDGSAVAGQHPCLAVGAVAGNTQVLQVQHAVHIAARHRYFAAGSMFTAAGRGLPWRRVTCAGATQLLQLAAAATASGRLLLLLRPSWHAFK
jgi:hypothetical protein